MTENTFHLVDAATGAFLRVRGSDNSSTHYLTLEEHGPAYQTSEIVDIHRIMRLAADPDPHGRTPYGVPDPSGIDDDFYPVTAVRRFGAILPGGESVLLSTELKRVDLMDVLTPQTVPSRDFKGTPRVLLKSYLPAAVVARIADMDPEFLVVRSAGGLLHGDFVLTEGWSRAKVGEVVHSAPLPEGWPLPHGVDGEGLHLVFLDYSSSTPSYTLSEMQMAAAAPQPGRSI